MEQYQGGFQSPNNQQYQYQPQYQPQQPNDPFKGKAIASMVLGIVSLALFCLWYLAIPCAVVGVILGFVSKSAASKAGAKNGMATAGIVCSFVSLGIVILSLTILAGVVAELGMM